MLRSLCRGSLAVDKGVYVVTDLTRSTSLLFLIANLHAYAALKKGHVCGSVRDSMKHLEYRRQRRGR